ncbi:fumarylacetoacetate hydrolase family protein [Oceanibacterium hippocampi]|uniref:Ureidoglycolate lyase n=1 Tax=Oceanibacterium hippocampi TaxID=745714 RepID=A0A1Y5RAX1_9PROT|nr:fumarylacetoacetate hydrolase family protein [Oceanibacterium hippocampi]SLN13153.1 Ureidoglycolate lyase [Oceanibacterium hippocampi]
MRLASYRGNGRTGFARIEDQTAIPLETADIPDLRTALGHGIPTQPSGAAMPLDEIEFLPPIPTADKILCIGLNYRKHAEEAGMALPSRPSIFCRFNGSQVGHGVPVVAPNASPEFDFEGELAVIVGRAGRNITEARAMDHVAGYACFAENSVRDFQKHGTQATAGKNFSASGAFGPWLTTADEIADPHALMLESRLNGEVMQRETTADMIFSIPQLIAYVSTWAELLPGDVIVTGTPSGVGFTRKPPVFMKPGDVFEVQIEGVGTLSNPIIAE